MYHTRMVYGLQIVSKIVPYAYGIKYAYGTEHLAIFSLLVSVISVNS